jgi:hypothetical protein
MKAGVIRLYVTLQKVCDENRNAQVGGSNPPFISKTKPCRQAVCGILARLLFGCLQQIDTQKTCKNNNFSR